MSTTRSTAFAGRLALVDGFKVCKRIYYAMATDDDELGESRKLCFVTIGATANFDALVEACLALDFLRALQNARYTHLLVQYGKEFKDKFTARRIEIDQNHSLKVDISGYDFKSFGTLSDMRTAKGHYGGVEGAVISHAGWYSRQEENID